MAYALVQDIASSWDQYERTGRHLMDPVPDGLILHLAGPTDEGFRVIDVWDSEASWRNFQAQRIGPAIAALGGPGRPQPTLRDLRGIHLVIGAAEVVGLSTTTEPRSKT